MATLAAFWAYVWLGGAAFPLLFLHFSLTRHYEPRIRTLVAFACSWAWPVFAAGWLLGWSDDE